MQILKLFSIRDSASETFTYPMCFITHGVAEREFKEIVNDKNSKISKNPEHYDLYELGSFNDATGKMELLDSPRHIIKAIQLAQNP